MRNTRSTMSLPSQPPYTAICFSSLRAHAAACMQKGVGRDACMHFYAYNHAHLSIFSLESQKLALCEISLPPSLSLSVSFSLLSLSLYSLFSNIAWHVQKLVHRSIFYNAIRLSRLPQDTEGHSSNKNYIKKQLIAHTCYCEELFMRIQIQKKIA